jgi:hypothetical protein
MSDDIKQYEEFSHIYYQNEDGNTIDFCALANGIDGTASGLRRIKTFIDSSNDGDMKNILRHLQETVTSLRPDEEASLIEPNSDHLIPYGIVRLDEGAMNAIREEGKKRVH